MCAKPVNTAAKSLPEGGKARRVYLQLLDGITRGTYPDGAALPAEQRLCVELGVSRVTLRRAPAWTTEWISAEGRRKLHAYGIAPPGPVEPDAGDAAAVPIRIRPRGVDCPRCGSAQT